MGNAGDLRGEPAAAELVFQKRVNAVEGAPGPAAGDGQGGSPGPHDVPFLTQPGDFLCGDDSTRQVRTNAQELELPRPAASRFP